MSDELIDVRTLIARHSNAEHVAKADAYFSSMPENPLLLRKPFFGLRDTPATLHGVSEVLTRLSLFPSAEILDFGAGTGWLSKILVYIGCRPVAVDVSAAALEIGRRAFEAEPVAAGLSIDWRTFDGERLPLADASVDRIVSFDAFHHVADQAGTLAEFYRVLRMGGRAVFHEPGPQHSRHPQSQYEMRRHGVVENDIDLSAIWRIAEAAGFSDLRVAAATPRSASLTLANYDRLVTGRASASDKEALLAQVVQGGINLRIFSIDKGKPDCDSRYADGLAGTFSVVLTDTGPDGVGGTARVTNTGTLRWRPSGDEPGSVSLGVRQLHMQDQPDYGRVWLSGDGVAPGETVEVAFTLPPPARRPVTLVFDLVSEHVAWFETLGSKPVSIEVV